MYINEENLLKTIKILNEHFSKENTDTIANVEFPKEIKYKSNEWLLYVFYSCLLDYGMRSIVYHKNLINTYHKFPCIFNPQYVVKNFNDDKEMLFNIIKDNIHPRYPNVAVNKWLKLSAFLNQYENLLNKIKTFNSFNELNKFINTSKSYGQKTGGLLLRLIYESNICVLDDGIQAIPLDRHDIEISYLNGIIKDKALTTKQIAELSTAYISASNKLKINPSNVDKYLWEIGNQYCNKHNCTKCPLCDNCKTKSLLEKELI